ncbi:MAG: sel1 repeat family protein [Rhodanobacteraceae bacterium]|nr:sel1 repeat family protein [Rhodanobacteraceae bacterium]
MLQPQSFPLLVDADDPGLVLPLPAALWPEALRDAWLDIGEQRVGFRFDPRAARHKMVSEFERKRADPAPIFLEGLRHFRGDGVPRDYQRARELWEQAAVCGGGHAQALNNLGVIYEQGLGVAVDEQRQFAYYSAAAMHGLALGQLNLGRWHVAQGDVNAALPYLRQAAAAGEADAADLLRQIAGERPAARPVGGLLGRLTSLLRR